MNVLLGPFVSTNLLSPSFFRRSSKKQAGLSALSATEPNVDKTTPAFTGAFSLLVRKLCYPHISERRGATSLLLPNSL